MEMIPLKVKDIRLWGAAKPAFELRLSALPPRLARLRWFEAICALEEDEDATPVQTSYESTVLEVLAMAFGMPAVRGVYPIVAVNNQVKLLMCYERGQWRKGIKVLTAEEMDALRLQICRLNGYKLPNEAEDPQLAASLTRISKHGLPKNSYVNLDDLCAAMALQAGCTPEEVWEWPMKKFYAMANAVTRMEQYRTGLLLRSTGLFKCPDGSTEPFWLYDLKPSTPAGIAPVRDLDHSTAGIL